MPETPLRAEHEALGARFTNFGGWEMPVQYEGVIAEHQAVRGAAGVFDVSHLGRFTVTGSGAVDTLRQLLCNDIAKIEPGRAQYTMALNEYGGVADDIIVWWVEPETLWVLPNGVNFDGILDRFRRAAPAGTMVEPRRSGTVLLAVQGPTASDVVTEVIGEMPRRFRLITTTFEREPIIAAGTGYTGERGAEILVPENVAGVLWRRLVAAGAVPCGLGARDTLRLEMGFPLWGQDLTEDTTPLEAGLGWVIDWDHDFVGKEFLEQQRSEGVERRLVAFRSAGRQIPRHGYPLRAGGSRGEVASGNFSPVLGCGIGMGYLTPPPAAAAELEVEIRGSWEPLERVKPPFIER
jgi:aminomethyltransferase